MACMEIEPGNFCKRVDFPPLMRAQYLSDIQLYNLITYVLFCFVFVFLISHFDKTLQICSYLTNSVYSVKKGKLPFQSATLLTVVFSVIINYES